MGYVCLVKATGQVLEYQPSATAGTILTNITNNPQYGFVAADVEEREVTYTEYKVLQDAWDAHASNPEKIENDAAEVTRQTKEDSTKTKLGLTNQEFQDLKDALK